MAMGCTTACYRRKTFRLIYPVMCTHPSLVAIPMRRIHRLARSHCKIKKRNKNYCLAQQQKNCKGDDDDDGTLEGDENIFKN